MHPTESLLTPEKNITRGDLEKTETNTVNSAYKTKKNSEVGPKEGVEEMADEDPDSELWGELNTDLESFLTEFVASK